MPIPNLTVSDHPLVAHYVAQLRDIQTDQHGFVALSARISRMLGYEAFADLRLISSPVVTPVAEDRSAQAVAEEVVLVPILRAGLALIPALQDLLPLTRLCLVGLRRDEATLLPAVYVDGLPDDLSGMTVAICDPMLATGGSLLKAIEMVKERGASKIRAICLIASLPGAQAVYDAHPDVRVFVGALDEELNEHGYMVPGLGDAGDRLFGPQRS